MSAIVQFLRPSAAATWTVCSGYLAMRARYPDAPDEADNDVREDGTACHWLADRLWYNDPISIAPGISPNGRELTDDMFDACEIYLDVLRSWPHAYVEKQLDCSIIHPGMVGTPDGWHYDPSTRTLRVADLKYGFRFVEVYENLQLTCYVAAIIAYLYANGMTVENIEVVIVQPRAAHREGPVRRWFPTLERINDLVVYLQERARLAMLPGALCVPNPGCGDCPARHACVAYQNAALVSLEQAYGSVPFELDPVAAGRELELLKLAAKKIDGRITGLEAQLEGMLRAGHIVPGYQLANYYARERWQEGREQEIITLGRLYGKNLAKPAKAITPAQARKQIPAHLVDSYAIRPSNGLKLMKLDPLHAEKAFNNEAPKQ